MRYYNPTVTQAQSTYVPVELPWDAIAKAGAQKQDTYNKEVVAVDDLQKALNIQGGYRTQQRAKELADKYRPEFEKVTEELQTTGGVSGGAGKVSKLINTLKADTEYQDIMADQAMKASGKPDEITTTQGFNTFAQNFIDKKTGQYKQTKAGERFDGRWYNAVTPGDPQKDFKLYYDQLHDVISQKYGDNIQEQANSDGSITLIQNGTKTVGVISKGELRTIANNLLKNDPNFRPKQPFVYAEAIHNQDYGQDWVDQDGNVQKGSQWSDNDNAELFVDNYLNNKKEEQQIQRMVGTKKGTSGINTGADDGGGNYNVLKSVVENLYRPKPSKGADGRPTTTTGTTTVGDKTMAGLIGGNIDEKGSTTVNLTGREVYLTTPQQVVSEGKEVITNRKAIILNGEYNQVKEEEKAKIVPLQRRMAMNTKYPGLETTAPDGTRILNTKGTGWLVEYDETGDWDSTNIEEKPIKIYHMVNGKKVYAKETYSEAFKNNEDNIINSSKTIKNLKLKALSQGIDLDSKETKKYIEQEASKSNTEEGKVITDFNQALQAGVLNGEFKFNSATDGDNVISDKEGNMFGRGYIAMFPDQIKNMLPDNLILPGGGYETLLEKGIIKESYSADGTLMYQVPVTLKSDDNTDNMTMNTQINTWGNDANTEKVINAYKTENANLLNAKRGQAQAANIEKALNTKQYKAEDLITDLESINDETGKLQTAVAQAKLMTNEKERNEVLADIWLYVNNPAALIEKNKPPMQNVGKSQGGWSQTPATPLKK